VAYLLISLFADLLMHYFFYGEDSYSIVKKTAEFRRAFVEKNSDFNLTELEGEKITYEKYWNSVNSLPFLGDKRLIIIKNIFQNPNKEIRAEISKTLEKILKENVVLFVDTVMPDKRESLFKKMPKEKTAFYFGPLYGAKLSAWIDQKIAGLGEIKITPVAKSKLILYVGGDLWRLENEISKLYFLAVSLDKKEIDDNLVENNVEADLEIKAFALNDALVRQDTKTALTSMENLLKNGEEELRLFNLIVYQFRTMIILSDLTGEPSSKIASETKLNPFVVSKTLPLFRRFDLNKIYTGYRNLGKLDIEIKTGRIEPKMALFRAVVDFCRR